jgi:hypothetical protein
LDQYFSRYDFFEAFKQFLQIHLKNRNKFGNTLLQAVVNATRLAVVNTNRLWK